MTSKTYPTDLDNMVRDLLGRIADKWSLVVIDELGEDTMRFSQLQKKIGGISQKMLTQTLRELEKDGLVDRFVYAQVPPRVEYRLTEMGYSLGATVCGLWEWAADNSAAINKARSDFELKNKRETPHS